MNYVDIIFIIILLISIYVGYSGGFYKILSDTILLFLTSYLSGILTNILFDKVITYLPFFNLWGASEGIKSINIIIWRVILYILIMVLLMYIIDRILKKTGIQDKLDEKIITMRKLGRYLGCLFAIPFTIVLIFNIILVFGLPIFNMTGIFESKTSETLMSNMILLKDNSNIIYEGEKYINGVINEDNTIDTYSSINDDIISYLVENKLINNENINKIKEDNKIIGTRNKTNKIDTKISDDESKNDDISGSTDNDDDINEDGPGESFDDEEYIDDDGPAGPWEEADDEEIYFEEEEY